jgi:UDP-2-acetamido-3-amino-2,3-dideoxy-glucuronate N-acetyltransferase
VRAVVDGLGPSSARLDSPSPFNDAPNRVIEDVAFGRGVIVAPFTNLYGCRIGDETRIGPFVEIQRGAVVGARCKVQSHTFICDGVTIGDEVFVGHGVMFVNDKVPRATTPAGEMKAGSDWELLRTIVERGASLGSGAIVLGGVRIGARAIVGAGAVVTRDVAADATVRGVPARLLART